jgi:hypothetical protein
LSSKNAGAPTGAGAMAQTPDFAKSYGSAVSNALMISRLFGTISARGRGSKSTDKLKPSTKKKEIIKVSK